ncbi:hypothetical protein V6R21_07085 [Limibacter armeniacum]|uniref:hypothetical protein n=1 Tax=Limibacter armeniacum TaxID=466084 RepID=UPI002FE4FF56
MNYRSFIGLLLLLFFTSNAFSQQLLGAFNFGRSYNIDDKAESFIVAENGYLPNMLFFINKEKVHLSIWDQDEYLGNILEAEKPERFIKTLGSVTNDDSHTLFFTTKNEDELSSIKFNLNEGTSKSTTFPKTLPLTDQKLLSTFTHQNSFYLLTLLDSSSTLRILKVGDLNINQVQDIDLKTGLQSFFEENEVVKDSLFSALLHSTLYSNNHRFTNIESQQVNPLLLSAQNNKLYIDGNNLLLTLDRPREQTISIKINLYDFSHEVKYFSHPSIELGKFTTYTSNSYYHDNKLYQVIVSSKESCLSITDFNTNELIQEYRTKKGDSITIKNSAYTNHHIRRKSKKKKGGAQLKDHNFIEETLDGHLGISVYEAQKNIEATWGAFKFVRDNERSSDGTAALALSTVSAGLELTVLAPITAGILTPSVGVSVYINPIALITANKNIESNYIKSLFDKQTGEYIPKFTTPNVLERIEFYTLNWKDEVIAKTLVKQGNDYILGYYDKLKGRYFLRVFEDNPENYN